MCVNAHDALISAEEFLSSDERIKTGHWFSIKLIIIVNHMQLDTIRIIAPQQRNTLLTPFKYTLYQCIVLSF